MFRSLTRLGPITISSVFPTTLTSNDRVTIKKPVENIETTGSERLRDLFRVGEFDEIAPEINFVLQSTFGAALFGSVYGGFIYSRTAYTNFIDKNRVTQYEHVFEAKKALQDKVTLSFARGAFRWGWRLSFFTATYTMITTCISVYRAKSSLLEYMVAGVITGGIYKSNLGLRASIVGGSLGLVLGTLLGGVSLLILKISGVTMEDVYRTQYKYRQRRKDHFYKMLDMSSEESKDSITDYHDSKVLKDKLDEIQANEQTPNPPESNQSNTSTPIVQTKPIEIKN